MSTESTLGSTGEERYQNVSRNTERKYQRNDIITDNNEGFQQKCSCLQFIILLEGLKENRSLYMNCRINGVGRTGMEQEADTKNSRPNRENIKLKRASLA